MWLPYLTNFKDRHNEYIQIPNQKDFNMNTLKQQPKDTTYMNIPQQDLFDIFARSLGNNLTVNKILIKLCESFETAALLTQIVYWFGEGQDGNSRVRFRHKERLCLIKKRTDWESECCLSPRQYDYAIKKLKTLGFVTVEIHKSPLADNDTASFIFLNQEKLSQEMFKYFKSVDSSRRFANLENPGFAKLANPIGITKSANPTYSTYTTSENTLMSDEDIGRDRFSISDNFSKTFNELIRKLNPAILEKTPAQLKKWDKVFDLMIRIDKRSEEDIMKILEFIEWDHSNSTTDFRWSSAVQSPEKLRKHFASIHERMVKKPKEQIKREEENKKIDIIKHNKEIAQLIASKLPGHVKHLFKVDDYHVSFKSGNSWPVLAYNEHGFQDQLESSLRKCGIL